MKNCQYKNNFSCLKNNNPYKSWLGLKEKRKNVYESSYKNTSSIFNNVYLMNSVSSRVS